MPLRTVKSLMTNTQCWAQRQTWVAKKHSIIFLDVTFTDAAPVSNAEDCVAADASSGGGDGEGGDGAPPCAGAPTGCRGFVHVWVADRFRAKNPY